jgi:iron-sulfur cluster assembly accessory protein
MLGDTVQTNVINLTPSAVEAVKALLMKRNLEGYALRVYVSGGGCSGFQYGMALEGNIRPEDFSSEFDGVKVVVDEISIDYLRGASIDYVDDAMGSGFKIDNPNALTSCNCSSPSGANNAANNQNGGCSCG